MVDKKKLATIEILARGGSDAEILSGAIGIIAHGNPKAREILEAAIDTLPSLDPVLIEEAAQRGFKKFAIAIGKLLAPAEDAGVIGDKICQIYDGHCRGDIRQFTTLLRALTGSGATIPIARHLIRQERPNHDLMDKLLVVTSMSLKGYDLVIHGDPPRTQPLATYPLG